VCSSDLQEISLTKDKTDFNEASAAVRHIFTSNLLRQTALDSIQGRGPAQVFMPVVSVPEMELLLNNWGFFEANIHSKAYSWIIRNIYSMAAASPALWHPDSRVGTVNAAMFERSPPAQHEQS
jgi:ribonucleotide reductase beta subunit family protein with ferritin-like domain